MMPVNKLSDLNSLPQVEATFATDIKAGTFTKACRFNPRDFPALDITCLETPISSGQRNNPYREYHALKKLQFLLERNLSDGVPKLLNWQATPGLTALTMELADKGPLADYFSVRDPEDNNCHILHPSIPGPMEQKLSLLIRCLVTLYLFAWMDIANNDLHAYNVVIATCDYDYMEIIYGGNVADNMMIPTYGIKPMIVDFGRATACIDTNPNGLDDTSFLLMEFTERIIYPNYTDDGDVLRTSRDEILQWALRYYAQLQDLLAERATGYAGNEEPALCSRAVRISGTSSGSVDIAAEGGEDCEELCHNTHSGDDADTASATASDNSCPQQTRMRTFDVSNIADIIANNREAIKADIGCKCVIC